MSNTPTIRIRASNLLYTQVSAQLHKLHNPNEAFITFDKVEEKTKLYVEAWQPYEKKILEGIQEITDLQFRKNIIDAYIAPYFWAFSNPLTIGTLYLPDNFIDILAHELIHNILVDNTSLSSNLKYQKHWKTIIKGEYSPKATVHIFVHAIHKSLYLDILDESERFERDLVSVYTNNNKPYVEAWEYVDKHGDKQIISDLKSLYKTLKA